MPGDFPDIFGDLGGLGGFSPETTFGGGGGGFDFGSLFGGGNLKNILGVADQAGSFGQILANILGGSRAPRTDRAPFQTAPFQGQTPRSPDPNQLRSILANKQASGLSTGGALAPSSIAAIINDQQGQPAQGISPELMQLITQYTQQTQR